MTKTPRDKAQKGFFFILRGFTAKIIDMKIIVLKMLLVKTMVNIW